MSINDTIAAISTPLGRGGIAVIRISGDGALPIADKIFRRQGNKRITGQKQNTASYGHILSEGNIIDDGLATVFRAPHSFTGEDTVEISCHGGVALASAVLSSAIAAGCRQAEAGEFTKRAFLNGKISLSSAEAVIGLIDAGSMESIMLNAAQQRGVLSGETAELCDRIAGVLASVYAYIDYPDEDLTDMSVTEMKAEISGISDRVKRLADSYRAGHAICEGILTAIVGKPNTGKSTLLNLLLGCDRAIVTDIPGTTRDTLEETCNIGRVMLKLCDTAGIHRTEDEVETIGISRSVGKMEAAELIFAVFDGSEPASEDDIRLIERLRNVKGKVIPLINKTDRPLLFDACMPASFDAPILISAKEDQGTEALKKRIEDLFLAEEIQYDITPVLSNARQFGAVSASHAHLLDAIAALDNGITQDMAGLDLEQALQRLGEIDGRTITDEITDRIFAGFCVGK